MTPRERIAKSIGQQAACVARCDTWAEAVELAWKPAEAEALALGHVPTAAERAAIVNRYRNL